MIIFIQILVYLANSFILYEPHLSNWFQQVHTMKLFQLMHIRPVLFLGFPGDRNAAWQTQGGAVYLSNLTPKWMFPSLPAPEHKI